MYCFSSQALTSASGAHLISKCAASSTSGVVLNFPPLAMHEWAKRISEFTKCLGPKAHSANRCKFSNPPQSLVGSSHQFVPNHCLYTDV